MARRELSAAARGFVFLIVFVIVMGCSQFNVVGARALRISAATVPAAAAAGCEQVIDIGTHVMNGSVLEESSAGLMINSSEFGATTVFNSSSSSSSGISASTEHDRRRRRRSSRVRSLVFKLASGPSKRGPGH